MLSVCVAGGAAGASASSPDDQSFDGMLSRKHEWESTTKKASNRSWDKVFCVLTNKQMAAYKDQKHAKSVSHDALLCIGAHRDLQDNLIIIIIFTLLARG